MKIAVISDTHGVKKYIDIAKKYIKDADVLIHLGDHIDDLGELCSEFNGDIYGVKGNCDYSNVYPVEQLLYLSGKKIFITHGHKYLVKSTLNNIYYRAREVEADFVLFGHTHEKLVVEEPGLVLMNPGSISLPRTKGRYIGFIEIDDDGESEVYLKEIEN